MSNGLTQLRSQQLKPHCLGCCRRVADVTLNGLGNLQGLLQLQQLLVEDADGLGPLGDLLDFVLNRDRISNHGDGVLSVGQWGESDDEKKE